MRPVSDFLSRVMPSVPGCPQPLAEQAIRDAAIAFCEDSLALRERLIPFTTIRGVAEYSLIPEDSDTQVARVIDIYLDGTRLSPCVSAPPAPSDSLSAPTAYYTTRVGSAFQVALSSTPDKEYTVVAEVALRPTRSASTLDDDLLDLWADAVTAGAIGRLSSVPGEPFTDLAVANAAQQIAIRGARGARSEMGVGRVRGSMRVTQRPLA